MAGSPGQADFGNKQNQQKKHLPLIRHELGVSRLPDLQARKRILGVKTGILGCRSSEQDGDETSSVFQKERGV